MSRLITHLCVHSDNHTAFCCLFALTPTNLYPITATLRDAHMYSTQAVVISSMVYASIQVEKMIEICVILCTTIYKIKYQNIN